MEPWIAVPPPRDAVPAPLGCGISIVGLIEPTVWTHQSGAGTGHILERLRRIAAGATAGVVTVESGHIAVAALLADADRLLYQAKQAQKGTFRHAVVPNGRTPGRRLARSPLIGGHDVDE